MPSIVIVNASHVLTDDEVKDVIPSLQKWDDTMLRPSWGFEPCTYSFMSWADLRSAIPSSVWPVFINNHSSDPGALGFHDLQSHRVYGRIFAGDCKRYGVSWTVDLSHECAEMRGDPDINDFIDLPNGQKTLRELSDPCESDACGIDVDGVLLSDFVLPQYWTNGLAPFDYTGHLTGPFPTLAPGGYVSIYDPKHGWHQITARWLGGPPSHRANRTSGRMIRRGLGTP